MQDPDNSGSRSRWICQARGKFFGGIPSSGPKEHSTTVILNLVRWQITGKHLWFVFSLTFTIIHGNYISAAMWVKWRAFGSKKNAVILRIKKNLLSFITRIRKDRQKWRKEQKEERKERRNEGTKEGKEWGKEGGKEGRKGRREGGREGGGHFMPKWKARELGPKICKDLPNDWKKGRKGKEGKKEKQYHAYGKVWNLKIRFKNVRSSNSRALQKCNMRGFSSKMLQIPCNTSSRVLPTTNALSIPCQKRANIMPDKRVYLQNLAWQIWVFLRHQNATQVQNAPFPLTSCIQNKPPTRRQRCALALAPQQQQFSKFDPYTKMFYKFLPIRMSTKVHNKRNVKILYSTSKM